MTRRPGAIWAGWALLGIVAASGCSESGPDFQDPASVSTHLFAVAANEEGREGLDSLFDPAELSLHRTSLLDALEGLERAGPPAVDRVEISSAAGESYVDLSVPLPGGGVAAYGVKLRMLESEGWRIAWFQGPGVAWPPQNGGGSGLTTSAPPETSPRD